MKDEAPHMWMCMQEGSHSDITTHSSATTVIPQFLAAELDQQPVTSQETDPSSKLYTVAYPSQGNKMKLKLKGQKAHKPKTQRKIQYNKQQNHV